MDLSGLQPTATRLEAVRAVPSEKRLGAAPEGCDLRLPRAKRANGGERPE